MKICLVTPSFTSANPEEPISLPMGLAYIAAVLEKDGYEVVVFDGAAEGDVTKMENGHYQIGANSYELARMVIDEKPDLIGIACPFTSRYRFFREIVNEIRKLANSTPIIAGGIHATLFPEMIFSELNIDAIILGEGEAVVLELVKRFEVSGKIEPNDLDGIAWKEKDKVLINPKKDFERDLDSLPKPARHLFKMEKYLNRSGGRWSGRRERVLSVLTSRSCPGRCTFCSIHASMGKKWRAHSVNRVLDEIEEIKRKYNPTLIGFEDDRFTLDRKRLKAICEGLIERKLKIRWYTPNGVHVNDLDEDVLVLMKKAGCFSLNLAIESGDPVILKDVINKSTKLEKAVDVAQICSKIGIKVNAYFMIGVPGETDETIQRTLDYCLALPLDGMGLFIATPFPGTKMFDLCVEMGYIDSDTYMNMMIEADDPDVFHIPLFETPTMKKDQLLAWEKRFNNEFMNNLYKRKPGLKVRGFLRKAYYHFFN